MLLFAVISVLIVSVTVTSISAQSQGDIPSWIKNTALWWGEGDISDDDFLGAMQYLIKEGILVIPSEQNEIVDSSQLIVQELKKQSVSLDYKDILRNEEYYKEKIIFLTGKIWSIDEKEDGWVMLAVHTSESDYGLGKDLMYIWYDGSGLLDNDIIEAYIVVDEVLVRESLYGNIFTPIGTAMHVTCTSC